MFSHVSGMSAVSNDCLDYPNRNMALDDCAKAILAEPLVATRRAVRLRRNSMQVAGAMAERATGKSWADLLQSELIQPLGLTATDFGADKRGRPFNNPIIAGGARSNQRDYAIVVQMVPQHGAYNGNAIPDPRQHRRDAARPDPRPADRPDADPYPEAYGYGYGEWVNVVDCDGVTTRVSSTGVFGTSPWVDYDNGIAAVFLAYQQAAPTELRQDLRQLWDEVAGVIGAPVGCNAAKPMAGRASIGRCRGRAMTLRLGQAQGEPRYARNAMERGRAPPGFCVGAGGDAGPGPPAVGDTRRNSWARDRNGDPVDLAQLRGKVVVTFWASWCGYCRKELPALNAMQTATGPEYFRVVAVNAGRQRRIPRHHPADARLHRPSPATAAAPSPKATG